LPLVFGLPIIFGPIHIAFLEMVIDPVCSLVFEAEMDEEDIMRRRPRAPNEPLFSWPLIGWSVLQGGLALILLTVTVILSLSLLWPAASALFRFGPLHADDLALTLAAGIVVLIVLETLKHLWRTRLGLGSLK